MIDRTLYLGDCLDFDKGKGFFGRNRASIIYAGVTEATASGGQFSLILRQGETSGNLFFNVPPELPYEIEIGRKYTLRIIELEPSHITFILRY